MGLNGNEVSAVNQQRLNEEQNQSPVDGALESATSVAGSAVALGASLVVGGPAGLALAGSVVAGMGIVAWFRKLGTTKVEENLEALGQAAEDAFNRVERVLSEQGKSIEEIQDRFKSEELMQAMASASLQALRTTEEERLKRLALVLANGVKEGDLEPESLDDMMRAAVELRDRDIVLLGKICISQRSLLQQQRGRDTTYWFGELQSVWDQFVRSGALDASKHLVYRSSFSRLESRGLIQKFREISTARVGLEPYALLEEGLKFYDRIQEIGVTK
jgi:hypothetical protein